MWNEKRKSRSVTPALPSFCFFLLECSQCGLYSTAMTSSKTVRKDLKMFLCPKFFGELSMCFDLKQRVCWTCSTVACLSLYILAVQLHSVLPLVWAMGALNCCFMFV